MELGKVGLGRIRAGIAVRLRGKGHRVVGFEEKPAVVPPGLWRNC